MDDRESLVFPLITDTQQIKDSAKGGFGPIKSVFSWTEIQFIHASCAADKVALPAKVMYAGTTLDQLIPELDDSYSRYGPNVSLVAVPNVVYSIDAVWDITGIAWRNWLRQHLHAKLSAINWKLTYMEGVAFSYKIYSGRSSWSPEAEPKFGFILQLSFPTLDDVIKGKL